MLIKQVMSITIAIMLLLGLFVGCGISQDEPTAGYTEVCDTSGYRKKNLEAVSVDYTSFSLDKYYNVYTVSDGMIRKYSLNNVLKDSFEETRGLSSPYWYEDYLYACGSDGKLVKISVDTKEMTCVSSSLPAGFALDIVVADNNAFILFSMLERNNSVRLELWQASLEDGSVKEIGIDSVKAIYASEGGCVYAVANGGDSSSYQLCSIEDGKAALLGSLDISSEINSFILENGYLYYPDSSDSNCITKLNLSTLEAESFVSNVTAFAFAQ